MCATRRDFFLARPPADSLKRSRNEASSFVIESHPDSTSDILRTRLREEVAESQIHLKTLLFKASRPLTTMKEDSLRESHCCMIPVGSCDPKGGQRKVKSLRRDLLTTYDSLVLRFLAFRFAPFQRSDRQMAFAFEKLVVY